MILRNLERRKNGGMMTTKIADEVAAVYQWIEEQIKTNKSELGACNACGECCDFSGYDHLLFVTTPELIYLKHSLNLTALPQMAGDVCPYNKDGKCSIHEHRFAACRIFYCKSGAEIQSDISEQALEKLKKICTDHNIPYIYSDLKTALNYAMPGVNLPH